MGDMGKIKFDQGTGGNGAAAIDDKSPTAWEESWDGIAAGVGLTMTGSQTYLNIQILFLVSELQLLGILKSMIQELLMV